MEVSEQKKEHNQDEIFNLICERGKVLINIMIKEKLQEIRSQEKIKNIMQDPMGIIFLKNPKVVDFDNKLKFFKLELKTLK